MAKKHWELSKNYSTYIRYLASFIAYYKLISQPPENQYIAIKNASIETLIQLYDITKELIEPINKQFKSNEQFCSTYRIYTNFLRLLYVDLMRLYRICYFCIIEGYSKLQSLDLNQTKSFYSIYKSFVNVTEETKRCIEEMCKYMVEPLPATLNYFKVISCIV